MFWEDRTPAGYQEADTSGRAETTPWVLGKSVRRSSQRPSLMEITNKVPCMEGHHPWALARSLPLTSCVFLEMWFIYTFIKRLKTRGGGKATNGTLWHCSVFLRGGCGLQKPHSAWLSSECAPWDGTTEPWRLREDAERDASALVGRGCLLPEGGITHANSGSCASDLHRCDAADTPGFFKDVAVLERSRLDSRV